MYSKLYSTIPLLYCTNMYFETRLRGRAIVARNDSTKSVVRGALLEHLRTTHPDIRRDFKIHVFCVSSYDYECLSGNRMESLLDHPVRCLKLEDTGIPTLKRHCTQLVNGRLRQKLENLLRGDCLSYLNGISALFEEDIIDDTQSTNTTSEDVLKALEEMRQVSRPFGFMF